MSGMFVDNDGHWTWRKFGYHARAAFAVLLSLAILGGGGWFVYHKVDQAYTSYKTAEDYPGPGGAAVTVIIPQGATVSQIGSILAQADVIKSSKQFRKVATTDATKFQAGEYRMRLQIPAATAVSMLLDPKNRVIRQFTVPEGLRVSEVLAIISKKTGVKLADLQKVAADSKTLGLPAWATNPNHPEGFLFPNTYQYDSTPTAQEVLKSMTSQFVTVATQLDFGNQAKAQNVTPLQALIVASIVQAEVGSRPQYMPQVASVIYNRLKIGQPLGLDTALHYGLNVPNTKLLPANATKIDNPYNTYLHQGLMPGPINSPGKQAMQAAIKPATTNYLYFVTVNLKTGETLFTNDYNQHKLNVAKFNAWCKANKGYSGCPTS